MYASGSADAIMHAPDTVSPAVETAAIDRAARDTHATMHASSDTVSIPKKTATPNKAVPQSLFFALSPELRNKIYRDVLVQPDKIRISTAMTQPPLEPGILLVNRQIRQEARAIYYYENHFRFDLYEIDASAYMRWVRAEPIIRSRLQVWFKMYIVASPDVAWQNLMVWLGEIHYRRVAHGPSSRVFPGKRPFRIVVGDMKELAARLKEQDFTWTQILHVLESLKKMLVASLPGGKWL
ncbi:hypothetical protein BST61_g4104 [Cercospora zeina]